jgi:hypothetical protein
MADAIGRAPPKAGIAASGQQKEQPMSAALDYLAGGEAGYTGADAFGVFSTDAIEAAQMQPFSGGGSGEPWWQSVIKYGATRAIDNRYGPVNVAGNTSPGSFAGQNGRTYSNGGAGGVLSAAGLSPLLLIAAAAVVALLLLKR